MKKVLFLILLAFVFGGCGGKTEGQPENKNVTLGAYGDSLPIKRKEVCRMLALCFYDYDEICGLEEKAEFEDADGDDDFYKYINACFSLGLMSGDGKSFRGEDFLTVGEADAIISAADKSGRLKIDAEEESESNPISYYIWLEIVEKLGEAGNFEGLKTESLTVLMTDEENSELKGYALTDKGLYRTEGLLGSELDFIEGEFLTKDGCIVGVKELVSDKPVLRGCLVIKADGGKAEIFYGGGRFKLACDCDVEGELPLGADVGLNCGRIESISPYKTVKEGKVIAVGENILFEDGYSYAVGENFKVYSTYDGVKSGGSSDIISGSRAKIYFVENKAVLAVCEEAPDEYKIRVAISADGGGLVHESVKISCDEGFLIKSGGSINEFKELDIDKTNGGELIKGKLARISPKNDGKISVNGKEYSGEIDVIKYDEGFGVVCEMDLRDYLYGVVCAEMPASYGEEALKAQALAARSYAYNQRLENRRIDCGANIDDTTAFQAFDPSSVCEEAKKAVDETEGEYITYDGKVINACFYSTSCGLGANSGDVWAKNGVFPSKTPEYLRAGVYGEGLSCDFKDEEEALKFFTSIPQEGYERDCPYYRWSFEALASDFNTNLGEIADITVLSRGEGGNVTELLIEGEDDEVVLRGDSQIRTFVKTDKLKLADGSFAQAKGLPSTFFAVTENEGKFYFYGGGYGHGVGMSQNGAKAMAEQGFDYKEIIKAFYKGCEVKVLN